MPLCEPEEPEEVPEEPEELPEPIELPMWNGFIGQALGIAKGLQYSEHSYNLCFETILNATSALDLLFNSLKNFYLPWY